jgi:peptidoglycan/xylan/chitin deacetylase (PgdA/CDA1 family)
MFNVDLIVLSYHRFVEQESDYRFSRTYSQFGQDISKIVYDWITIDDGMRCMIKACDMLRYCNIRAKLFICTGLVGQPGYCTWDELKELSKYHDIENHSHIHKIHSRWPNEEIFKSIETASDLILKHIGRKPRYFVPPYNTFDDDTLGICQDLELTLVRNRINILNITK